MKEKEELVKDRKEEKKEGEEIKTQNKTQNKTQKDLVQMSKSYFIQYYDEHPKARRV